MANNIVVIDANDIKMETIDDDFPDLSWLGEFSDTPAEGAIRHSAGGREYKWFNPANYDADHPEYAQQDYERMTAYNRGDWRMIGIRAKIVVYLPVGNGYSRLHTFTSGGLWGIESDSPEYHQEIFQEEKNSLLEELRIMGFNIVHDMVAEVAGE